MRNPFINCEKRGCGPYHDICEHHIKFTEIHNAEKQALKDRYDFARSKKKVLKGHKGWESQKNIGY